MTAIPMWEQQLLNWPLEVNRADPPTFWWNIISKIRRSCTPPPQKGPDAINPRGLLMPGGGYIYTYIQKLYTYNKVHISNTYIYTVFNYIYLYLVGLIFRMGLVEHLCQNPGSSPLQRRYVARTPPPPDYVDRPSLRVLRLRRIQDAVCEFEYMMETN